MKLAVTGIHGNIGSVLVQRGAIPLDVDITDLDDVRRAIEKASPDIVINTASKSKPDWCEKNEDEALKVNFNGAMNVAFVTQNLDIPMVALSTDHVFSGSLKITPTGIVRGGPYSENYMRTWPVNYYGMTKLGMEAGTDIFAHVKVVRTSNCFWIDDPRVGWYIQEVQKRDKVPVPTFQYRSFMHREHFCRNLETYCHEFDRMPKILHLSGSETINWYDFVREFARAIGMPEKIISKFKKKRFDEKGKFIAERPKKVGLKTDLSKTLGFPQYSYKDGLKLL